VKFPASVKGRMALVLIIALLLSAPAAEATGWKPNVLEGSDIVMKDHRWPAWDAGTYYCFWYMSFVPGHPRLGSFYGGINTRGPNAPPGMFMSYWGEVNNVHEGPLFYSHGYGAEGASGGAHGDALFLRPGDWYRFVMRIFPPGTDSDKCSLVGWWVEDLEKNEWHTHSVVRLPARATGFTGNSGFVEALAPAGVPRAFERRLGYCRLTRDRFRRPGSRHGFRGGGGVLSARPHACGRRRRNEGPVSEPGRRRDLGIRRPPW